MKLNKKKVTIIIVLISIALLGLTSIQGYLLKKAYNLQLLAFHQNVNTALRNITQRLENQESLAGLMRVSINQEVDTTKGMAIYSVLARDSVEHEDITIHRQKFREPNIKFKDQKIIYVLDAPQKVRIRLLDSLGHRLEELVNEYKPAGEYEINISDPKYLEGKFNFNFASDSTTYLITMYNGEAEWFSGDLSKRGERRVFIDRVMDELSDVKRIPIQKRLNQSILDSTISTSLNEQGITQPYAYGIIPANKDTLILVKPAKYTMEIRNSEFRSRLFPTDFFMARNDLAIYFPQSKFHFLKQSGALLFTSIILISILIFSFTYTIRTIFQQKHFSTLLTDFINNMTHEFKTPISTITLASETLTNETVIKNETKLIKYSEIIHDESSRMRNQVEKILQMAILEEGDFELNITEVDIHDIIHTAVENMAVLVEGKKGQIAIDFKANIHTFKGDTVHLGNIIHNMLDNAIKYTEKTPEINVSTENEDNRIKISISDNGIGLKPEEKELVFDKYYRVPTGNVHNVKGFGLGLSYVKLISEAHGGSIEVDSVYKNGSTFHVILPIQEKIQKNVTKSQ